MTLSQIKDQSDVVKLAALRDHLRNSSSFQKTLAARAVTGIMDASTGRIVDVSPALEQLFGYLPGELLGKEIHVLVPDIKRSAHRSHVEGYCAAPEPRQMGSRNIDDLAGQTKGGHVFKAEIALDPVVELGTILIVFTVMGISRTARQ